VRVLLAPAVEPHLRGAVGPVVAVAVGEEQQLRRGADPDAAEADLQPADQVQPLGEDRPPVEAAVVVRVLEDQDPVLRRSSGTRTGYEYASATQTRPRSSSASAIGWTTSAPRRTGETRNPSGTVIARAASSGASPSYA
jgi:hypothetical protein